MSGRSSIFDLIGPVMVGPSSSHTAGVVRLARVVRALLGTPPRQAIITFYNSFAKTYRGHGSDKAAIGGLLGYAPDDKRIKDAFDYAKKQNLCYTFATKQNVLTCHPNTMHLDVSSQSQKASLRGKSIGGGRIEIEEVNGFETAFTSDNYTLLAQAKDQHGTIAHIASVLAHAKCNIATMSVARTGKKGSAFMSIEIDGRPPLSSIAYLKGLKWLTKLVLLEPL